MCLYVHRVDCALDGRGSKCEPQRAATWLWEDSGGNLTGGVSPDRFQCECGTWTGVTNQTLPTGSPCLSIKGSRAHCEPQTHYYPVVWWGEFTSLHFLPPPWQAEKSVHPQELHGLLGWHTAGAKCPKTSPSPFPESLTLNKLQYMVNHQLPAPTQ